MTPVQIVGGGFAGLSTAFYLIRRGIPVELFERSHRLGGLVSTHQTPHGPVETAARGVLNSARVEDLFREIGVPFSSPRSKSARYIFRDRPRRWPLGPGESLALAARLTARVVLHGARIRPRPGQSVAAWGRQVVGRAATDFILAPALQGIYAGRAEDLSGTLIFSGRRLGPGAGRPRKLIAPPRGMGQLIEGLRDYLEDHGARLRLGQPAPRPNQDRFRVICTSARDAARVLEDVAPEASRKLSRIEMLPLVTATCFYSKEEDTLPGFGVLFPRRQGFRSLGVLFGNGVFERRAEGHSETWILGGAEDRSILGLTDADLFDLIDADRLRLHGRSSPAKARYLTRWEEALPHYTVDLETMLPEPLCLPPRTYLVGNYLGGIGLARILDHAHDVAARIEPEYRRAA